MERGPTALFGAIVAVGLGPALWLGAQFGDATVTPQRPPTVIVQQNDVSAPDGGAGAGDSPEDGPKVVRSEPKVHNGPLRGRPKPVPAATSSSPTPSPSASTTSTPPTESTRPPTDDSQEPSTPPTGSSSTPPAGADPDEPDPPLTEVENSAETEKVAEA
ncbi:hypothetical protein AB0M36_15765 [Actinoplanes sp. NPDC051346]|uniref:hypothetical protein n=1 Tax=Actinoplanes sp. NPDC051346 TaxID=3155048 RepID=UPI00343F633D